MRRSIRVLTQLSLALLVASNPAMASEQDGQWYVNGMATYLNADRDFDLKENFFGGQVSVGRAFSKHWNLELEADYLDAEGDFANGDAEFLGAALNALYVFNRDKFISPYLIAGVGALGYDPEVGSSSTRTQVQGGAGFLLDLFTERLALRAEILGRWADFSPDSTTDRLVNVGLQWSFGQARRAAPIVAAAPVAAAVVAPPPPSDSDGDGVIDDNDRCPNTPAGAAVNAVGCPDTDGDGFYDDVDQCPNTIKGALIDDVGCGYQLSGVQFGFDSDVLAPSAENLLDEVADRLKQNKNVGLVLEGYTDSRGADAYNLDLSTRRAQSAKDYLASQGVSPYRMVVVGKGEADPVASNETEEGRAANRRVVLKVDSWVSN